MLFMFWLAVAVMATLSANGLRVETGGNSEDQVRDPVPLTDLVSAYAENRGISYPIGFQGSGSTPRASVNAQAKCQDTYTDVEWVPSKAVAQAVVDAMRGTNWRTFQESKGMWFREDHAIIKTAEDFIWLYIGSSAYSANVERVSRGAIALHDDFYAADVFKNDHTPGSDVFDATALALRFSAGLAAAIALIDSPPTAQTLYRGASEPKEMINILKYYQGSGKAFLFPGLASLTTVEKHAISFMGRGPYGDDYWGKTKDYSRERNPRLHAVERAAQGSNGQRGGEQGINVLYEFSTSQAKDITRINPKEAEWLLPPNRKFTVLAVMGPSSTAWDRYYHVKLTDAA